MKWPYWFPPARATWIALAVLAIYGTVFLKGVSVPTLLLLPILAVAADLSLQRVRFPSVRWPDAAITSGLFLTLLLPPAVPLIAAGTVTVAAIVLRHSLRYGGRPALNPAATGLLLGTIAFGTAPAWWVAVGPSGEWLMLGLAGLLVVRNLSRWQLPVTFLAIYAPFMLLDRVLFGAALAPHVLILGVLDPALLFFAFFMVTEPRTAPSESIARVLYAGLVALGAVFLPTVLPSVGILVALLLGNLLSVWLRWDPDRTASSATRRRFAGQSKGRGPTPAPWTASRRASATMLVLLAVGVVAAGSVGPSATPSVLISAPPGGGSGGGTGGGSALCAADNPAIPASTLATLHKMLGPSVILSYSPSTGTTVFYDPANQVTVTETDLYEDYGYAEFNGDDYAVSGCSP